MVVNPKQMARQILRSMGEELPVDIYAIARAYNIDVKEVALEDSVSGVLVIKNGRAIIGVNETHLPSRQRFTIAHEVGHYLLHRDFSDVFVDASPVFFRDGRSSDGTVLQEVQANAFAAELLMPEIVLRRELRDRPVDAFDDLALRQLAMRFGVSVQALTIRLTRLGLITLD